MRITAGGHGSVGHLVFESLVNELGGDRRRIEPLGHAATSLRHPSGLGGQSKSPGDTVTLAESALRAERELTPAVAGSLYSRLAVGAAHTGDATASQRAQDRAFELLGRSVAENEPPWIYWFTEADAQGVAGESLPALGRAGEAEPHLRRAVGLLDTGLRRDRALWRCELASARLGMGSVEQACATATEAAVLIHRLNSHHGQRKLADFRVAAAPYARSAAVREFDAKHRDLVGASLA